MIPGIDVSDNNGHVYWPSVAASGKHFVIAKVSQGVSFRDPTFAYNYAQMRRVGMKRGGYHFADPTCNPVDEANLYVGIVKANGGFEIRPILDLEQTGGKTPAQLQAYARMWGYEVQRLTGFKPILYSYTSFIAENELHTIADLFDLWLADYSSQPDNGGWPREPLMWQYSDTGRVTGIQTDVDLDWCMGDLSSILVPQPPVKPSETLLREGDTGERVKVLQTDLNKILHTHIAEDGDFGPITEATVRAFQCVAHISIDGVAGPQTFAAIERYLKGDK